MPRDKKSLASAVAGGSSGAVRSQIGHCHLWSHGHQAMADKTRALEFKDVLEDKPPMSQGFKRRLLLQKLSRRSWPSTALR